MEGEKVKMKRFDKAFKVQAVKMVTEEGQKASEVARSLGIHANMPATILRHCWLSMRLAAA